MAHTLDPNRIGEVIDAIMESPDVERKLTSWELDEFMPSIQAVFKRDGGLSERRLEVLEQIYLKI